MYLESLNIYIHAYVTEAALGITIHYFWQNIYNNYAYFPTFQVIKSICM